MKNFFVLGALTVLLFSCASDSQQDLEQARFYLDKGEFSQAQALVEPILAQQPHNNQAKFILSSALVGTFALSKKTQCGSADTGYLGILACLLEDKNSSDQNGLKTFERIAPSTGENNGDIHRAVALLTSITKFDVSLTRKDVALQRLIARAFDIASVFQQIGANTENVECNAGGAGVDHVPDGYDTSSLSSTDAKNFVANIEGIEEDARIVGFDADFNLIQRANAIRQDLEDNGVAISDVVAVKNLFNESYNTAAKQVCH